MSWDEVQIVENIETMHVEGWGLFRVEYLERESVGISSIFGSGINIINGQTTDTQNTNIITIEQSA